MHIRTFHEHDLAAVTDLTIATFQAFYEESFRPLVGEVIFANQHGHWRDDYRREVAEMHRPANHKYVWVADADGEIAAYVAFTVDVAQRTGEITHVAVSAAHRRLHLGTALCRHAFGEMRALGAEVATIGTGGDPFHAPARALYESLQCTMLPTAVYYRQL